MASQIARIFLIDQKIRTKGKVTLTEIIEQSDVSVITVKRDIEAMRDRLNAPIVYDRKLKAYIYSQEFKLLNFAGEQLFLFYVMSRGIAKNSHYLPLTAEYSRKIIIDKINEILPEDFSSISDNFLYFHSDYERLDTSFISIIITSLISKKKLTLYYYTKSRSLNKRIIEPGKVICYGAKWFLAAYCYNRKSVRIFSMSRVDKLELTNLNFEQQELGLTIDTMIEKSFGIAKSNEISIAKIKFSEPSSYYVKNQIWHPDQVVNDYEVNGERFIELNLPYGMPEELIGKVLKYGSTAEIISPKKLRDAWLDEIKKLWNRNEQYFQKKLLN
jgi:predicted DNA-binding transcriptional regulator YafY